MITCMCFKRRADISFQIVLKYQTNTENINCTKHVVYFSNYYTMHDIMIILRTILHIVMIESWSKTPALLDGPRPF